MSCIPYGYRIVDGEVQIDPDAQRKLRHFFERYVAGETVKEAGRDVPASLNTKRLMLTKSLYCGTDYYPPLIAPELFEEVQRVKDYRRRTRGGRRRRSSRPVDSEFKYVPVNLHDPIESLYQSIVPTSRISETE